MGKELCLGLKENRQRILEGMAEKTREIVELEMLWRLNDNRETIVSLTGHEYLLLETKRNELVDELFDNESEMRRNGCWD